MPRFARIQHPGGIFHVISRCLNREFLLDGREERDRYLALLGRSLRRSDAQVLAWCVMSNHVHLVVQAGEVPLDKLMKPLNTGFAQWRNRRGGRIGPVFAGRYRSVLVEEDRYLLELVRYVHNNPVRAQVATRAEDSDWTSHRAYVGLADAPAWLSLGPVLTRLSEDPLRAREDFAQFVRAGVSERRRPELAGDRMDSAARAVAGDVGDAWRLSDPVLGSDAFIARVLGDIGGGVRSRAPAAGGRKPELEELLARTYAALGLEPWQGEAVSTGGRARTARRIVAWLWVRVFGGSQAEMARVLQTSSANVSNWYGGAVLRRAELEPLIDEVLRSLPDPPPLNPWKVSEKTHYLLALDEEAS